MPAVFDCIRPLCRRLRGILFPLLENEELDMRPRPDPQELYGRIIRAFDDTLDDTAVEEDTDTESLESDSSV
jgi:hypothetical protein